MLVTLGFALAALPVAFAATYDVSVGAGGKIAYDPEYVTAAVGDIVNFVFHPKNHTVTQSAFETPCVPLYGGFDSGFNPVASETGPLPTFQIHVNDTNPIWVHCEQKGHCGQGMVFAVNPPPDPKSFKAFQDLAIATNGTGAAGTTTTSTATDLYVTPPPPHRQTAAATVTDATHVWTTTYSRYDGTPPPTPAVQPIDHKIIVGPDGQLVYNPANISAAIGDTVTFEFRPKNHTVTQSSFLKPCEPLVDATTGAVGFKSGFQPVDANATTFPQFQIKINDTAPIWGYCGQVNHCGAGMVFSINAVESGPNNFGAFQALAKHTNATSASASGSN